MARHWLFGLFVLGIVAAVVSFDGAALAGDAAKGKKVFNKCKACHKLEAGKHAVGPSLYGVVGRKAGSAEGFKKYSASYVQAGENGLVWNEENLDEYLDNPKKYIRDYLGDAKAKSKMTFRLKGEAKADDRADVIAYLTSVK